MTTAQPVQGQDEAPECAMMTDCFDGVHGTSRREATAETHRPEDSRQYGRNHRAIEAQEQ